MPELSVLTIKAELEVANSKNNKIEILSEERAKEIEENIIQNGIGTFGLSALTNSSTFGKSGLSSISNSRIIQLIALLAAFEFVLEKGGQLRELTNKAGITPEEFFPEKSVVKDDRLPQIAEAIRNPNTSQQVNFEELRKK